MSKITIGKTDGDGKDLKLDLDLLITSRLLIQANSGGGKSWLLRRLAEQCWGKVQVIIIDPEGEFFTLREKFGYVLVGEGGETPADVRSAALLAEKFLQLKASAVCDLYEAFRGRPMEQRQWVRVFLDALLGVPRSLWHPVLVIVDEAHKFCPQETPKAGNQRDREIISECKNAMISLSTTGRKRGFCAIWATQRLAKVDKDASAEMFNRLVGMTIEDVDVDRAADLMSVSRDQKQEFRASLRALNPGQFYAFGRAITTERKLVMVGDVQTHHPETGKAAKNAEPPPMPDEVKGLLPQLADLPKAAEEKARTEAEFKREIRELRSKLVQAEKAQPKAANIQSVKADPQQVRMLREFRSLLGEAMKIIAKINATGFEGVGVDPAQITQAVEKAATEIQRLAARAVESRKSEFERLKRDAERTLAKLQALLGDEQIEVAVQVKRNEPATVSRSFARPIRPISSGARVEGDLGSGEKVMLVAVAQYPSGADRVQLTVLTGYKRSTRDAYLQRLSQRGYISFNGSGTVLATEEGVAALGSDYEPLPTGDELRDYWLNRLPEGERKILQLAIEHYPDGVNRDLLSETTGYARSSRDAYIQRLEAKKLVQSVGRGEISASHVLFEDAA